MKKGKTQKRFRSLVGRPAGQGSALYPAGDQVQPDADEQTAEKQHPDTSLLHDAVVT